MLWCVPTWGLVRLGTCWWCSWWGSRSGNARGGPCAKSSAGNRSTPGLGSGQRSGGLWAVAGLWTPSYLLCLLHLLHCLHGGVLHAPSSGLWQSPFAHHPLPGRVLRFCLISEGPKKISSAQQLLTPSCPEGQVPGGSSQPGLRQGAETHPWEGRGPGHSRAETSNQAGSARGQPGPVCGEPRQVREWVHWRSGCAGRQVGTELQECGRPERWKESVVHWRSV